LTELQPTTIERRPPNSLVIGWNDGRKRLYTAGELRKACPCATCREKNSADAAQSASAVGLKGALLPVLSVQEARPLIIEHMRPVGNYAYNISFSDGHDSGLFTFDYLLELGQQIAN
jgi:DUF971 family protein